MGMFDTIWAKCPQCEHESGFQTKSGLCLLEYYDLETAPQEALINVNRHAPNECENCGTLFEVDLATRTTVRCKT